MRCIILAAGYGTRMYPLTYNRPKALLNVYEKPLISHLVDRVRYCVDSITVVTNSLFYDQFVEWSSDYDRVTILDDGTLSNNHRLGAVRDMQLAVESDSSYLVMASDNYIDFSLDFFVDYFNSVHTSCVMYHELHSSEKLQKTAVIQINDSVVTSFEEKPRYPASTFAVPPFYIYVASDLLKISEFLSTNSNADSPGSFASWLCCRSVLHAVKLPGSCIDVSDLYERERKTHVKTIF